MGREVPYGPWCGRWARMECAFYEERTMEGLRIAEMLLGDPERFCFCERSMAVMMISAAGHSDRLE